LVFIGGTAYDEDGIEHAIIRAGGRDGFETVHHKPYETTMLGMGAGRAWVRDLSLSTDGAVLASVARIHPPWVDPLVNATWALWRFPADDWTNPTEHDPQYPDEDNPSLTDFVGPTDVVTHPTGVHFALGDASFTWGSIPVLRAGGLDSMTTVLEGQAFQTSLLPGGQLAVTKDGVLWVNVEINNLGTSIDTWSQLYRIHCDTLGEDG
jgi:hypothetical protein